MMYMLLSLGKILPLTRTLVILDDLVVDLIYRDLHHDVIFYLCSFCLEICQRASIKSLNTGQEAFDDHFIDGGKDL